MNIRYIAFSAAGALALVSCGGGATTNPLPLSIANISGDYAGTMQDSVNGAQVASASLAQHSASAGGTLTTIVGGKSQNVAITLAITSSNALSGSMAEDLPSGVTCAFSTSGTYNPTTNQITGTYASVSGCGGENGTYSLTQQCMNTVTASGLRRTKGVPAC